MRRGWLALGSLFLGVLAVSHWGCEVPPLMAPGSSVTVIANPMFIVANGGVSLITALLVEPAGTLVPDGTVAFFFTNLGRIDPEGRTRNGVARVNLVSDARSGRARVTVFVGGPAPAGTGAPSGTGSASVEVDIGSALPTRVVVVADPVSVRGGGHVTIIANVFDANGNPVANAPVIFSITAPVDERLESGGAQQFTDNNGRAFDTLITRPIAAGGRPRPIIVTATVPALTSGVTSSVTVNVNP